MTSVFSTDKLPEPKVRAVEVPKPTVNPVLRERLDIIGGWLALRDANAKELWDVLSALRGPDDTSQPKANTTEVIRTAAFP